MGARGFRRPPLIGVTTSEVRRSESARPLAEADPAQNEMVLGMVYARAVQRAGGMPVVLPPLAPQEVPELVGRLEGLCLSGGPDLDPKAYDARAHAELGPIEPDLDRWEIALTRQAEAAGLPILGICRGCQVLNVARGGTLYQHLPAITDNSVAHRQRLPGRMTTHHVRVEPGSRLARQTLLAASSWENIGAQVGTVMPMMSPFSTFSEEPNLTVWPRYGVRTLTAPCRRRL